MKIRLKIWYLFCCLILPFVVVFTFEYRQYFRNLKRAYRCKEIGGSSYDEHYIYNANKDIIETHTPLPEPVKKP